MDIIFELKSVNLEALDADLRAALGAKVSGVSYHRGMLTLHLLDTVSEVEQASARAVAVAHDATRLSPAQQAQVRLRQSRLENRENPLSSDNFNGQSPLIRALAAKIAWLEQEILDLRR